MAALNTENLLPWLQKQKDLLNLTGIATAAGISPVTLRAYVSGDRNMPAKTAEQLLAVLREAFKELYEPAGIAKATDAMQKMGNAMLAAQKLGQL